MHNEALSVAGGVNNPDRSPNENQGLKTSRSSNRFLEIVAMIFLYSCGN